MFKNKSRKLDLSFVNYLTDEDINDPRVPFDKIKRDFPLLANSNLEVFRMYLILNHKHLTEDEQTELQKTIAYLQEQENKKYLIAIDYIERIDNKVKIRFKTS